MLMEASIIYIKYLVFIGLILFIYEFLLFLDVGGQSLALFLNFLLVGKLYISH